MEEIWLPGTPVWALHKAEDDESARYYRATVKEFIQGTDSTPNTYRVAFDKLEGKEAVITARGLEPLLKSHTIVGRPSVFWNRTRADPNGREPNVASNNGDSEMHLPRRGSREHESKHDDKVRTPESNKVHKPRLSKAWSTRKISGEMFTKNTCQFTEAFSRRARLKWQGYVTQRLAELSPAALLSLQMQSDQSANAPKNPAKPPRNHAGGAYNGEQAKLSSVPMWSVRVAEKAKTLLPLQTLEFKPVVHSMQQTLEAAKAAQPPSSSASSSSSSVKSSFMLTHPPVHLVGLLDGFSALDPRQNSAVEKGSAHHVEGRFKQASEAFSLVVSHAQNSIKRRAAAKGKSKQDREEMRGLQALMATSSLYLGHTVQYLGRTEKAAKLYCKSLQYWRRLHGKHAPQLDALIVETANLCMLAPSYAHKAIPLWESLVASPYEISPLLRSQALWKLATGQAMLTQGMALDLHSEGKTMTGASRDLVSLDVLKSARRHFKWAIDCVPMPVDPSQGSTGRLILYSRLNALEVYYLFLDALAAEVMQQLGLTAESLKEEKAQLRQETDLVKASLLQSV